MAVKTGTKKSTVKKGVSTSTPKPLKSPQTTDNISRIEEAILSMTVSTAAGIAAVNEEIKKLASMQQETALAQQKTERAQQELVLAQQKTELVQQETALAQQKTERAQQELVLAQQKTELAQQKTELVQQETKRAHQEMARAHQEMEIALKEAQESIREFSRSVNYGLGGVRNSIGHIVEMVLLPGLSAKMNALGHKFTHKSYGDVFEREDGSKLAEIDLYLENGREVMVVEAKTHFEEKDVTALLERVQKLRKNEKLTGVAGKTIYAAAAGVTFEPKAYQMIEENGIYLVEVNEENDKIKVKEISIEEAGKW